MGPLNGNSILLLEDDEALLDLIPRVLSQAGFVVTATASAASARNLLVSNSFELIICDLSVIGGEAAFTFINSLGESYPQMSCLIITGIASDNIREQAELHHIEIVEKPFAPTDLTAKIVQVLKSRAA
jgi:two-component system, OmpR family, phosphate regulon response regulator OmpR